ncbi:hypothetical protein niasHS_002548 [Heterodera schachtii]|uniref:Uncharacterized protein n=1 Tax=Heterodera schachtii TaxID=97005 RepID=A0ABD2KKQ5_HETSC
MNWRMSEWMGRDISTISASIFSLRQDETHPGKGTNKGQQRSGRTNWGGGERKLRMFQREHLEVIRKNWQRREKVANGAIGICQKTLKERQTNRIEWNKSNERDTQKDEGGRHK